MRTLISRIASLIALSWMSGCSCAADHVVDTPDARPFYADGDSHFFDTHQPPPDAWRADVWPASEAVTVVLLAPSGEPIAGSRVYFHDATGALVDTVPTDADGAAASGGPGIAAITVPSSPSPLPPNGPLSIWGVSAGDTITLSAPIARETATILHAPSDYLSFVSAVDRADTPGVSVMLWDSRAMPALFALGFASSGPAPYALLSGLPPGGPFVASSWRTDYDRVPVMVTGAPSGTHATALGWLGSDVGLLVVGGDGTSVLQLPHALTPGPGAYIEARAGIDPGVRSRHYSRLVPYETAAGPEGVTVDLGSPPVIDAITFDHDTLDVSWGTNVDAYAIELSLGIAGGSTWTILAPGPATHLAPPQIPSMPRVDPTLATQCGITFHGEANYADYRAFRQHPLGPFDPQGWAGTRTWVWEQLP